MRGEECQFGFGREVHGVDGADNIDEDAEEGRAARVMKDPEAPSREEIERHNITHLPYRSWCPHCVRGRGRARPHQGHAGGGDRELPVVSADYAFFGKDGDVDEKESPVLVLRDSMDGVCTCGE